VISKAAKAMRQVVIGAVSGAASGAVTGAAAAGAKAAGIEQGTKKQGEADSKGRMSCMCGSTRILRANELTQHLPTLESRNH
jgi:hypothetical protein